MTVTLWKLTETMDRQAASPATAPDMAPTDVGAPSRMRSTETQVIMAAAAATYVVAMARAQSPLAAKAEPPLKPVHPSQRIPPPKMTKGRLLGKDSERCLRSPSSDARANAEVPELM